MNELDRQANLEPQVVLASFRIIVSNTIWGTSLLICNFMNLCFLSSAFVVGIFSMLLFFFFFKKQLSEVFISSAFLLTN